MDDLIRRKDAIDLCDWYDNPSMHDDLIKLPSAQAIEVVHCKDCKYRKSIDWGMGDCLHPKGSSTLPMITTIAVTEKRENDG